MEFFYQIFRFSAGDERIRRIQWPVDESGKTTAFRVGDNPTYVFVPFKPSKPNNNIFDGIFESPNIGLAGAVVARQQADYEEFRAGLAFTTLSGQQLPDFSLTTDAMYNFGGGATTLIPVEKTVTEARGAYLTTQKPEATIWDATFTRIATPGKVILTQSLARHWKKTVEAVQLAEQSVYKQLYPVARTARNFTRGNSLIIPG